MSIVNSTFNQQEDEQAMSVGDLSYTQTGQNEQVTPPYFVTQRSRPDHDFRKDFVSFQETITSTLERWFTKYDDKQSKLLNKIEEVKKSLDFMHTEHEKLNKKTDDICFRLNKLEEKSAENDIQICKIAQLQEKIDTMKQHARQCNVEINNLPERRGEDLVSLMTALGAVVKQPIMRQDIVAVHRVPHADNQSKRPKNVIVKLSSKILRDNLLSATRLAKGVTTDQLNMSGPPQKIFLNEHLTLKNKQLFRETRLAGGQSGGFKYTWIKNGVILVREKDTSPTFAVRRQEDLLKITRKTK